MKFRVLKYFLMIAREENITKAAGLLRAIIFWFRFRGGKWKNYQVI